MQLKKKLGECVKTLAKYGLNDEAGRLPPHHCRQRESECVMACLIEVSSISSVDALRHRSTAAYACDD